MACEVSSALQALPPGLMHIKHCSQFFPMPSFLPYGMQCRSAICAASSVLTRQ